MPKDPKKMMLLATQRNGLSGGDMKPWHLKTTYKLFDEKGNSIDQGTYEEFWVSQAKYKRILTSSTSKQTDYGTNKGMLRSGAQELYSELLSELRRELIEPLPVSHAISMQPLPLNLQMRESNGAEFACVNLIGYDQKINQTWCFDADKPALRISASALDAAQFFHSNNVVFQNHFIAGDLRILKAGKPVLDAHLESIEQLTTIDEADFTPSPDAAPVHLKIALSEDAAQGLLIRHSKPIFPPIARAANVSGSVVLQVVIGTNGRIASLHVISGPAMLQQAAIECVRSWIYKPFLLDGQPLEVSTNITVKF